MTKKRRYDSEQEVSSHADLSHSDQARAIRRGAIEEEKRKHEDAIRQLNTQLNELLPVARLLPELLVEIFMHSRHPNEITQRVRFTHVCRRWRDVALEYPMLWSGIYADHYLPGISWQLTHAKQLPLQILIPSQVTVKSEQRRRIWSKFFANELHRVSELTVQGTTAIDSLGHAGKLRHFVFHSQSISARTFKPFLGIFGGSAAPELRSMSLKTRLSPFSSIDKPYHPNLTALHWSCAYQPESLDAILDVLEGMPRLESLTLPLRSLECPTNDRVVTLVHLRELTIPGNDLKAALELLSHLDLPCAEVIVIAGGLWNESLDLCISRIGSLSKLQCLSISSPDSISEDHSTDNDSSTDSDSSTSSGGWMDHECAVRLSLTHQYADRPTLPLLNLDVLCQYDDTSDVEMVCKALPLSEVELVVVKNMLSNIDLLSILSQMPRLRILQVCDTNTASLLNALFLPILYRDQAGHDHPILQLQTLEFNKMTFRDREARAAIRDLHDLLQPFARRCKFSKVVYEDCTGLDAKTSELIRGIAGAIEDNFSL